MHSIKMWSLRLGVVILPILGIVFMLRTFLPNLAKSARISELSDKSTHFETDHFLVVTEKIPKSPLEVANQCEEFYSAFLNKYSSQIGFKTLEKKIEVFFFGNRQEFDDFYKKAYRRSIPHNAAFYTPTQRRIVLYWNNQTKQTLYHELTHMILDVCVDYASPNWNIWFNEGFASYCENSQIVNGVLEHQLDNADVLYVRQAFQNNAFVPISRILESTPENFRDSNNSIYYAESYLLICFLIREQETFFKYFQEEGQFGQSSPLTLSLVLQKSNATIEKEFLNYFSIQK